MLLSLAVDYRHADVATRERFHLSAERVDALYVAGRDAGGREGAARVALATCARSEVYAWVPPAAAGGAARERAFGDLARAWMGGDVGARDLLATARRRTGDAAAHHLLRVAAGVESQVLGDAQLLGQLRDAHCQAAGTRGGRRREMRDGEGRRGLKPGHSALHRLFEHALRVGKRVRTETALASGRHSVGSEAANVAARRFGSLAHARVVVVGCGKTGERCARQLVKLGARDLVLINRSPERAVALAAAVGGRAAPFASLHVELAMADVAVAATSAESPVVDAVALGDARRACATAPNPLLVLDLAMPRNVEPGIARLAGLTVVDLDALRPAVTAGEHGRAAAVPHAERIVDEECEDFLQWMRDAAARDAIRPLCTALEAVCRREVAYAVRHATGTEAADDAVAERTAQRVVAKLLAQPMAQLRHAAARGEPAAEYVGLLERLFHVPPADVVARDGQSRDPGARDAGVRDGVIPLPALPDRRARALARVRGTLPGPSSTATSPALRSLP